MDYSIIDRARAFLNGQGLGDNTSDDEAMAAERAAAEAQRQTQADYARERGVVAGLDGEDDVRLARLKKRNIAAWHAQNAFPLEE